MSDDRTEDALGTAEQRRHERRAVPGRVVMTIEGQDLGGRVDNLSGGGVMLVADGSLRVWIEVEADGATTRRRGRLVRVQRLNSEETVYAVEFDRE